MYIEKKGVRIVMTDKRTQSVLVCTQSVLIYLDRYYQRQFTY